MDEGGYTSDLGADSTHSFLTESAYGSFTDQESTDVDTSTSSFDVSTPQIPEFVNTLPNLFICNICKHVAINPTQSECGHLFCKSCIEEYFDSNPGTKVCPTPDDDYCHNVTRRGLFIDKGAMKEIKRQNVFCTNKSNGCHETMTWSKLGSHLAEECRKAMKKCQHCLEMVPREKNRYHTLKDCPQGIERCLYSRSGCTFKGTPDDLKQHEKDNVTHHLQLCNFFQAQQDLKLAELSGEVNENKGEIEVLKKKTENLQNVNSDVKKLCEENSKRMKTLQKLVADQGAKILSTASEKVSKTEFLTKSQEINDMKEAQLQLTRQMSSPDSQASRQFAEHDQKLVNHNVALAENDLRFQALETTNYSGVLVWKIKDYTRKKQDAMEDLTWSLYSLPFYTSRYGYKMCARIHLNGTLEFDGSHVSLSFCLMKDEYDALLPWPFRQKVTLMFLNQDSERQDSERQHLSDTFTPDPTSICFRRPTDDCNPSCSPWSVLQTMVENDSFKKNDTIFVKVVVDRTGIDPV